MYVENKLLAATLNQDNKWDFPKISRGKPKLLTWKMKEKTQDKVSNIIQR